MDDDSTPRTNQRHATDPEMPSAEFLRYQLKDLRVQVQELRSSNAQQTATLARIETALAVGGLKMKQIDTHLEATDRRVERLATGTKRSAHSFWAGISGFIAAIVSAVYTALHGTPK